MSHRQILDTNNKNFKQSKKNEKSNSKTHDM